MIILLYMFYYNDSDTVHRYAAYINIRCHMITYVRTCTYYILIHYKSDTCDIIIHIYICVCIYLYNTYSNYSSCGFACPVFEFDHDKENCDLRRQSAGKKPEVVKM